MRVFGLTGGIATGKSTVATLLTQLFGVTVLDADKAARSVLEPGTECWKQVWEVFGPEYFSEDSRLNRSMLRQRIIDDPSAKAQLEAITHPAIQAHILRDLKDCMDAQCAYAIVEAALMVETGSWKQYEALFVVSCTKERQIERLVHRDGQSRTDAEAFIDLQMPMRTKEGYATAVIQNNGTLPELRAATTLAWRTVLNTLSSP